MSWMREYAPAPPWKRVLAFLVDLVPICLIVAAPAYFLTPFGTYAEAYFANPYIPENQAAFYPARDLVIAIIAALYLVYSTALEASPLRGTPGMRLFGVIIIDRAGQRISYLRSAKRALVSLLSTAVLLIGHLVALFDERYRTWHDRAAGTLVVHREW